MASKDKHTHKSAEHSEEQRHLKWARIVRSIWEDDRADFGSGRAKRRLAVPPVEADDRLFAELSDLAQVPARCIEMLRNCVSYELSLPWGSRGKSPTVKREGSKKLALIQLRRSESLARELFAVLSNLDKQASKTLLDVDTRRRNLALKEERERLFAQDHPGEKPQPYPPWPDFPESRPYLDSFPKITNELAELLSEAHSVLRAKPRPNPRGRPRRGAFSAIHSASLTEFTLRLLLVVRFANGQLSIDKNSGEGTLVDALNLLRPYLPRGFIPQKLPMAMLDKVRTLDRKIALEPPSELRF